MVKMVEKPKGMYHSKFHRHVGILMWKSYLQRQRRWKTLVAMTLFASILFTAAVFIAKPVFLTPLQAEPEPPLTTMDILASLQQNTIVGYAPDKPPFNSIMEKAAQSLAISIMTAATEYDLNHNLFGSSKTWNSLIRKPIIWVLWQPKESNKWQCTIRSSERARYATDPAFTSHPNPHLRAGFLAVQLAISQAIMEHSTEGTLDYELSLVAMPVSPLMQQDAVRHALSGILLCFTLAFIPPMLETQALVVTETNNKFKRALRMRGVEYIPMYLGWLTFAYLTALPVCFLASITLLLIFRWIHLLVALMLMLAYFTVMIMAALVMAMFNSKTWIACLWSTLFTLLQTYLAELLVHHEYDRLHATLNFLLQVLLPPLGLVNAFNQFALLQTGRSEEEDSLLFGVSSWVLLIVVYFTTLMLLQSTIGQERAIGGQVSWRSIIFKKIEDVNALHAIETPTGREREKLQEVDELVAKAVSFYNVSKSIMGVKIINKITLDVYRGEFTMMFTERVQHMMVQTVEDLITGLTYADKGEINVLGQIQSPGKNLMTVPHMMGYCHHPYSLIDDLTVREHFFLYSDVCMWSESRAYISQYSHLRIKQLMEECHLESVSYKAVGLLDVYYRAQLCWAIAVLMEPKIVIIPDALDQPSRYIMVVKDKIMQYRKYITIIKMCFSSLQLENADRVFVFDNKLLAFGGTPAYMFFKFGREYRVRMTMRSDYNVDETITSKLIERAEAAGATVRAHLGSLLILRLPANPTEVAAALVKDIIQSQEYYGVASISITVPDSEEVCKRALTEARATSTPVSHEMAINALKRFAETPKWKRIETKFCNSLILWNIGWKYFTFHAYYRLALFITIIAAFSAGIFIGLSFSSMLATSAQDEVANRLLHGELLTFENRGDKTNLVLRSHDSANAISLSGAYILSEPGISEYQLKSISYTALAHTEELTEYLVTLAIDSPQIYVKNFAYGMDVKVKSSGALEIKALYSLLHSDKAAAARSLAKVYTALLRHYTEQLNATIQITDDPLALDLTPWMKYATKPPLFLQVLLILTIAHITLIPSMERGLIRHVQSHAMNFSPACYWLTLYLWDLILYWMLVALITGVMLTIFYFAVPASHFQYGDLLVVPFMLILYGVACAPQAYLFSLGPRVALNLMTFIIVNIVLGETTIIAKLFYGEFLSLAIWLMNLSPQFNMAYAFVKIKQIFLYNSECVIFKSQNLCSNKSLHKCCEKCGVLQDCFKKRNYMTLDPGILGEAFSITITAVIFTTILLLVEYNVFGRIWKVIVKIWLGPEEDIMDDEDVTHVGVLKEKQDVCNKWEQINKKRNVGGNLNTFGECLLAYKLSSKHSGVYVAHNIYLGMSKGKVIAVSGLKRHGRLRLVEMLAGVIIPSNGHLCCMSKWKETDIHNYARQISISYEGASLPSWMTVYDALYLIALLRGVPKKHVEDEINNVIESLELITLSDTTVSRIKQIDRIRLNFAAAIIGAPPILLADEFTANQKFSVQRAMYAMLHALRNRGHSILVTSSNVEAHMPITNCLAIMLDGTIYDVDTVDNLVNRYSKNGYTVVVHLKDELDVNALFATHFTNFVINDSSEVLVNVQVLDELTWDVIFEKMELLKTENHQVYSYIVTAFPIDYIYNSIISNEKGHRLVEDSLAGYWKRLLQTPRKIRPSASEIKALMHFEQKYYITSLKGLPWSVIFHSQT